MGDRRGPPRGSNDDTIARSSPGPRPAVRTSTATRPGSPLSSTSRNAWPDGREHLLERRHAVVGQLVRAQGHYRLGSALDPPERLVVDHDGHAVGGQPHIELDPVAGGDRERGQERRDRVLGPGRQSPR